MADLHRDFAAAGIGVVAEAAGIGAGAGVAGIEAVAGAADIGAAAGVAGTGVAVQVLAQVPAGAADIRHRLQNWHRNSGRILNLPVIDFRTYCKS